MDLPYIYYIPIYPDDDSCEMLMHLFAGQAGMDEEIMGLLEELDQREKSGEAVDYVAQLEQRLTLKRLSVRQLPRRRSHAHPIST
ncbi:MAG: hypothetical protein HC919_04025 [Oscillatoriales cyanobacterium SM2_2_1]|nr:hypothetical protein [Oscillatoriales cyanobacterium SM2_2_1]